MTRETAISDCIQLGVICCILSGCATTDGAGQKPYANQAVPANYKELIALDLARSPSKLIKAEISLPGLWEDPLGLSGARPIACARLTIDGAIIEQTYRLGYIFENGQIADKFDPSPNNPAAGGAFAGALRDSVTCGKLTYAAFPELIKLKQQTAGR